MKKNNLQFLVLLLFIFINTFLYFYSKSRELKLNNNYTIVLCKIIDVDDFYKADGLNFKFIFKFKNKSYIEKERLLVIKNKMHVKKICLNKNMILVIDTTNVSNIYLPIKEDDFKNFDIKIPDSLKVFYKELEKISLN